MRVLVVDDDEGVRLTLKHVLTARGYKVSLALNGLEALEQAQSFAPDVVLTDMLMPKFDGIETIQHLKKRHPDLTIIAMSGGARRGASDILSEAIAAGADHCVAKPFNLAHLIALIAGSTENE